MSNLGSSKSTKEHERISGNVVITNITVSGNTVIAKTSGQCHYVYISGGTIPVTLNVSGVAVTVAVSGNWVDVSGATVISKVSGESLYVYISGGNTSVSGAWVNVSGATVISKVSGEVVFVYISGGNTSVSGAWVDVSGSTIKAIPVYSPISVWSSGAGAIATTLSNTGTNYFEYVEYNATSGATISSEFYITHTMATGRAVKLLSLNMAEESVRDLLYTSDNPMVLMSGDQVSVVYNNPENRNWNLRIVGSN